MKLRSIQYSLCSEGITQQTSTILSIIVLSAVLGAIACDENGGPSTDAGIEHDSDSEGDADEPRPRCPDCSELESPLCQTYVCNEIMGTCELFPHQDGERCYLSDICSDGEVCQDGECQQGSPIECPTLDGCRSARCDPDRDRCVYEDAPNGSPCSTICVTDGECSEGECVGDMADCSWLSDACSEGLCHEETGECIRSPLPAGLDCDDEIPACHTGLCDGMGSCEPQVQPAGTSCPEGDASCTLGICNEVGTCVLTPRPEGTACPEANTACEVGRCNDSGGCNPQAVDDGTTCDDGVPCTTDEICDEGSCAGTDITTCENGDGCCLPECTDDRDCCTVAGPLESFEHWALSGSTRLDEESHSIVLTPPENNRLGQVWLEHELNEPFIASFRFRAASGRWAADGVVFMFYKDRDYEPRTGGSLGYQDSDACDEEATGTGYGFVIDNYQNGCDADDSHFALVGHTLVDVLTQAPDERTADGDWHDVIITVAEASIEVEVDGELSLRWEGTLDRSHGGLGFSAATGGLNEEYVISDVSLACFDD